MKKKQAYKWFVELHEPDYQVNVFRNGVEYLAHVEDNGPITGGVVEVPKRTHERLKREFKNKEVWSVGLPWNKYAPQFGFDTADK